MDRPKPIRVIRFGRVKVAIWMNEGPSGPSYRVQVCRVYKEGERWKQSDSFGRDDLPIVCKAIDQAHTWIYQQARADALQSNQ